MADGLEIERKFLVGLPEPEYLDIKRQLDILQTYLVSSDNSQRRVRRISENGNVKYFYTEKIFLSAVVRRESEREIDEEEYNRLLSEKESSHVPIEKCRICFMYKKQLFELDIYPFSDIYAIMEIELENPEQEIIFPEYINIIKEVTGIGTYSNAALADAGKFPDEPEDIDINDGKNS